MKINLPDLRTNYKGKPVIEAEIPSLPHDLFKTWLKEVVNSEITEPNAMVLSSIGPDNFPDSRVVLLKGIIGSKLVFFTDYNSDKGGQIEKSNKVSLLFFWKELYRQVRIRGEITKSSTEESDKYFNTRPLESRVAAMISEQSKIIPDRQSLEEKFDYAMRTYKEDDISRPENWGGYKVEPVYFEFWQGRNHRLHDRIVYELLDKKWKSHRLSP